MENGIDKISDFPFDDIEMERLKTLFDNKETNEFVFKILEKAKNSKDYKVMSDGFYYNIISVKLTKELEKLFNNIEQDIKSIVFMLFTIGIVFLDEVEKVYEGFNINEK